MTLAELLTQRKWQIIVSIPTFLYFFILLTYLSPNPTPEPEWRARVTGSSDLFWNFWRLDQNWNLFSPVIRSLNHHEAAIITLNDGTKTLVELPRNTKLGLSGKFKDEWWRKWSSDSLPFVNYKQFRPDVAKYLGRRFYNEADPPADFSLTYYTYNFPPPNVKVYSQTNLPPHSSYSQIFQYQYGAEDFQR
jgi:hypothetical protein